MPVIISKRIYCIILSSLISLHVFAGNETDKIHDSFDQVLATHVVDGHVNYAGIEDDPRFFNYLETLKSTNPDSFATEQEKLAFWINTYNALAIKGILDGLSPSTFFGRVSYFKTTDYEAGGRTFNLYDLERDIIIPFNEPRIHFAIVCASISCPKLISEAYTAAKLEQQLNDNAKAFINNSEKNDLNINKKTIRVSKIFDWFDKDFEKYSGSVPKYIAQFVNDAELRDVLTKESLKVRYLKYDWNLNGTPPAGE